MRSILQIFSTNLAQHFGVNPLTFEENGESAGFRISSDPLDSQEDQPLDDADRGKP